jgi:hypothetical protein
MSYIRNLNDAQYSELRNGWLQNDIKAQNISTQELVRRTNALTAFRNVMRGLPVYDNHTGKFKAQTINEVFSQYPELIPMKLDKYNSAKHAPGEFIIYKDRLTGKEMKYHTIYKYSYGGVDTWHTVSY